MSILRDEITYSNKLEKELWQRVDLYEPFKSFILDKDLECLTKEIKPNLRQNNQECSYARSDGRWVRYRATMQDSRGFG